MGDIENIKKVLDIDVYTILTSVFDDEQFEEFILATIDGMESAWEGLLLWVDRDIEQAARYSHTIKGIALNIGATHLARSAGILTKQLREQVVDTEQLDHMKVNLDQVTQAITR